MVNHILKAHYANFTLFIGFNYQQMYHILKVKYFIKIYDLIKTETPVEVHMIIQKFTVFLHYQIY